MSEIETERLFKKLFRITGLLQICDKNKNPRRYQLLINLLNKYLTVLQTKSYNKNKLVKDATELKRLLKGFVNGR